MLSPRSTATADLWARLVTATQSLSNSDELTKLVTSPWMKSSTALAKGTASTWARSGRKEASTALASISLVISSPSFLLTSVFTSGSAISGATRSLKTVLFRKFRRAQTATTDAVKVMETTTTSTAAMAFRNRRRRPARSSSWTTRCAKTSFSACSRASSAAPARGPSAASSSDSRLFMPCPPPRRAGGRIRTDDLAITSRLRYRTAPHRLKHRGPLAGVGREVTWSGSPCLGGQCTRAPCA